MERCEEMGKEIENEMGESGKIESEKMRQKENWKKEESGKRIEKNRMSGENKNKIERIGEMGIEKEN